MNKRIKKKWKDFEITKVKLNPEQAVLSCCAVEVDKANKNEGELMQCMGSCSEGHLSSAMDS